MNVRKALYKVYKGQYKSENVLLCSIDRSHDNEGEHKV